MKKFLVADSVLPGKFANANIAKANVNRLIVFICYFVILDVAVLCWPIVYHIRWA